MIWADRQRTDGTLRKFTDSNGNEQNVHIEEIQANITQNGTPVNATTMNNIEKNIGTYGEDTYDNTATYQEGDIVTHNALLYRAKQDISTAEEWTAAHWEQTNALEQITSAGGNEIVIGDISDVTNKTKLLIETDTMETLGTEVVDTLTGNEQNRAPSVHAVKDKLVNVGNEINNGYRVNILKGTNLFDKNNIDLRTGYILNDSGTEITDNTGGYTRNYSNVEPNTQYVLTGMQKGNGNRRIYYYDSNKTFISRTTQLSGSDPSYTFTTPANCNYVNIQVHTQIDTDFSKWNLELAPYVTPSINVDGDEIYSKPNYASYQGTTTSSQTITGTTATTINNLSLNIFTTGKPLCIATGFLAKTANASYSAKVKIYIDGVEKVDRFGTIISTNDMYYPLMIILNNIEAGSHTIEIKVAGENTNSSITFATWYTRYLNAWELM